MIKPIGQYMHVTQLEIIQEHVSSRRFFQSIIDGVCIAAACNQEETNAYSNFEIE